MCKMYKRTRFKWLRNFVAKHIWIRFLTKLRWLCKFCFPCEHTHTFSYQLPSVPWFYKGKEQGTHGQLKIVGCYLCGKLKIVDWGK